MKGISSLSIIPVRKEPSDRSEMVTQILFGETFSITGSEGSWSSVVLDYDQYQGWIDSKQATILSEENAAKLAESPLTVSLDLIQLVLKEKEMIPVVLGSSLPFYYGKKFFINEVSYGFDGNVKSISKADTSGISENAFMYINAPYLWGGRSPFGIDCSGFTQMVFKLSGISLLRDAAQQATMGQNISIEESLDGDLAFFKNGDGKVVHVGIILNNKRIIHSSGKVRIDTLDERGIFNSETGKHSHALASISRIR
jgi:cell wall-associated NlpC family hydrolase